MILKIEGVTYTVSWEHHRRQADWKKKDKEYTVCVIRENDMLLQSYTVPCSLQDQYDKEKGRKESLKHALAAGDFTREQRKMFWVAYHGQVGMRAVKKAAMIKAAIKEYTKN